MAKNLQILRGNEADAPVLNDGEPGFALDTKKLLIGSPDGNVEFCAYPESDKEKLAIVDKGIVTAGDGSAYTATVPGIDALTIGDCFIMVPNVNSAIANPTLNVNSLGAKQIRRRVSGLSSATVATGGAGNATNWLVKNKPFRVTYNGSYWIVDMDKINCNDLYGTAPIANGGTGADNADDARTNLGAAPAYTYGTADITAGSASTEPEGSLHLVYEA